MDEMMGKDDLKATNDSELSEPMEANTRRYHLGPSSIIVQ